VEDRPGIIATLAGILMRKNIGVEAVLQEPCETREDLPFVIIAEPTYEHSIREALEEMSRLEFMRETPLALPMETSL
jgi:homoserine dehydrogenase